MKNGILEIDEEGTKRWILNGKLHRLDGPAVIRANGDRYWLVNGKRHRLDGPSVIGSVGSKLWYVNDIPYTEYEFTNMILTHWRRLFS